MTDETLPPKNLFLPPDLGTTGPSPGLDGEPEQLETIGPYRVLEKLGVGGMGIVYKCMDDALERPVAVKVIRRKYAGDPHYRRRFLREARAVASVSHPSIAHVYGVGEFEAPTGSRVYIAMELVDGPSVEALLLRSSRLDPPLALRLARETAEGLREALSRGIIHRDVKPSNLLVTSSGRVKIVDFGLAKEVSGQNSLTDEGVVLGTPHYISPEQGRGKSVDHRTDIYSLGATLYHMLTGKPPFEGDSQVSVIVSHVNDPPVPPHEIDPALPSSASRVVLRMLAKAPEARYETYDDLIVDLEALEGGGEPPGTPVPLAAPAPPTEARVPRRRRRRLAALLVGIGALVVAGAAALLWGVNPAHSDPTAAELGSWYRRLDDGRDLLLLDFARPPDDPTGLEAWRRAFVFPPRTSTVEGRPRLSGDTLLWESFSMPFSLSPTFEAIDEIRVAVGATRYSLDLGLAVVDPLGSQRRCLLLRLRLRPGEETPSPLLALRNDVEVPVRASSSALGAQPTVPRLGQGPFEVAMGFERLEAATLVRLRVTRGRAPSPAYRADLEVAGDDWASGAFVIRTESPVTPFSVALQRILVRGKIAPRSRLEVVPWRS